MDIIPFKFKVISSVVGLLNLLLDGVFIIDSEASEYSLNRVILNDLMYYDTTGEITHNLASFILNADKVMGFKTNSLSRFTSNEIRRLKSCVKLYN